MVDLLQVFYKMKLNMIEFIDNQKTKKPSILTAIFRAS